MTDASSSAAGSGAPPPSGSAADTRDLLRFLPTVLIKQIHDHAQSAGRWREGREPLSAAFIFVDVAGMHALSGKLATVEQLALRAHHFCSVILQSTELGT